MKSMFGTQFLSKQVRVNYKNEYTKRKSLIHRMKTPVKGYKGYSILSSLANTAVNTIMSMYRYLISSKAVERDSSGSYQPFH